MYGYVAFYKSKMIELVAQSSYEAQQIAARVFKAKKAYEVVVFLVAKDGEPVLVAPAAV